MRIVIPSIPIIPHASPKVGKLPSACVSPLPQARNHIPAALIIQ